MDTTASGTTYEQLLERMRRTMPNEPEARLEAFAKATFELIKSADRCRDADGVLRIREGNRIYERKSDRRR